MQAFLFFGMLRRICRDVVRHGSCAMGRLFLVRHGQASFGAADYDNLSALGHKQAARLGEYFRENGQSFDTVFTGTLRRHGQTWAGIAEGMQPERPVSLIERAGLNEYDPVAIIKAIHPEPLLHPQTPEDIRNHFRLLRDGLASWMQGRSSPEGMSSYPVFLAGVTNALDEIRSAHFGKNVLVASSGGPISTAVGHILGASHEGTIDLNLRIRNSSVSEIVFTPRRHSLVTYNTLPHLDGKAYADWVTYA
jgi:broad specificity phosphatase PhoE